MDDVDRQLLTILQSDIPLKTKPFDWMAKKMSIDPAEVLFRIQRFKSEGLIRHFGGIFDARTLGFKSTLIAMQLCSSRMARAIEIVHAHPGVFASWVRRHDFNFWFYLSVGPKDSLQDHAAKLEALTGAEKMLNLPALRVFKAAAPEGLKSEDMPAFSERERNVVRRLQQDFPMADEPFLKIAADLGISEPALFQAVQALRERGVLKRVGAVFGEAAASQGIEAWTLWQIPEEKRNALAAQIAGLSATVSCVKRPDYPDFPYSVYVVLKARGESEIEEAVAGVKAKIGAWPHLVLPAAQECKRTQLQFFSPELEAWSRDHGLCLVGSE